MANHTKPGTGKSSGYRIPAETLWLNDDAETALAVFCAILDDRTAAITGDASHESSLNRAALDTALTEQRGTLLGELLHIAVIHAESIALPWTKPLHQQNRDEQMTRPSTVTWDMAVTLAAEAKRLSPPTSLSREDSSTCSHGVSFADICPDCEA